MAIAPANADALFDRGVQPHLEAIVRERASADPALAAAAVNALGSLILGQRSHDAARRGDTVELLAATVRKGPREAVLAAIDALSAFMARSAPAQKRVLAQGLVRPVVRLLGAGMEACSDLRSVPLAAEAVAPRRAKGPAGRPRSERAAEEEIASAEAEIAEEGTRREERRGLRRRRGFRVEGGRGSGEGRESSGTDDTIEHGDVARASEIAERRARREREEQEEREREREEALGAEDDLTTDDVMESEEPDTTAARRAAARFVMQACASPEGQALAVQAGAVAVLGWALRSRDFLVADACTRALDVSSPLPQTLPPPLPAPFPMRPILPFLSPWPPPPRVPSFLSHPSPLLPQSILTGAAGLGKGDEMTRRMKDSGVILHAHAVLESNPSGPQAPALRHLIARVTPYRRDALQITFAMALIGALAVHFLTASPAALTLALCAWVALLGAFARKLEHTHFFPSLAFLAVVAALHHGALRLFPASSTVAYAAALAVASVLSLSNGSSPQTSDAVLVALTLLSGATEALAGTAWATVVHCCAAFLGESLASAYDGGLMLPCTPGARGQSFKDLPFLL